MQQAEEAHGEALAIRRKLAGSNPDAYLPGVATTLNNLACMYLLDSRTEEADTYASEAEGLLAPLWQASQELHGNTMAKVLWTRALVLEAGNDAAGACAVPSRNPPSGQAAPVPG